MAIPSNITNEQQAEILNALNSFFAKEYEYVYSTLSEAIDDNGLIGIAYTEYEDEEEYYGMSSIQVSYDLNSNEYVYIYDQDGEKKEQREDMSLDCFIEDLKMCDFNDFVYFEPCE